MEVIMVTSGATGMGRRLMHKHGRMNMTMAEMTSSNDLTDLTEGVQDVTLRSESKCLDDGGLTMGDATLSEKVSQKTFQSACATGGQFEMMSLYNSL
jgi:glutamate 5-kinase